MSDRIRSLGWFDAAAFLIVGALAFAIGCAASDGGTESADSTDIALAATATAAPPADTGSDNAPAAADGPTPTFHADDNPPTLSGWGQLVVADGSLAPAPSVTPYDLNSALFSDHSSKLRTVWIPDGTPGASYNENDVVDFPVGTVITKTFFYGSSQGQASDGQVSPAGFDSAFDQSVDLATHRVIETRILVHRTDGWHALPYVWNRDQTEATLQRTGDLVRLTLIGVADAPTDFVYQVPNVNQCAQCHATDHTRGAIMPIGPKVRHLNRVVDYGVGEVDQLEAWRTRGLLAGGPAAADAPRSAVWSDPGQPLDERARAYLDINCAHCHNSVGPADTSGLFLEPTTDVGPHLGICKPPVAAGTGTGDRRYGITPGSADESIFVFRMETTDPASMMPELGRSLTDEAGLDLIAAWIDSLAGDCS